MKTWTKRELHKADFPNRKERKKVSIMCRNAMNDQRGEFVFDFCNKSQFRFMLGYEASIHCGHWVMYEHLRFSKKDQMAIWERGIK